MQWARWVFLAIGIAVFLPQEAEAQGAKGICGQVKKACADAGFKQGAAGQGLGLIKDCFNPLLSGDTQPPNAKLALPPVEANIIALCNNETNNADQKSAAPPPKSSLMVPGQPAPLPANAPRGPNIVFFLADDFAWNLMPDNSAELAKSMPNLKKMMDEGTTFTRYFVTDSLCCPSRTSIFTGKLPHNSGVYTNSPPFGGYAGFMDHNNEGATFAVALHKAGYRTAMLGKYLNGYKPGLSGVPLGWSEWDVDGEMGYSEYNYNLNQNGKVVMHPEYLTDEISKLGQDFIAKSGKSPFFIELASFAPHAPYVPPQRYLKDFSDLNYPQTPAFAARPDATAPEWEKLIPELQPDEIAKMAEAYRNRVRSDHAIDDMIGAVRDELKQMGIDKNTYLVFSSDNGYHMGEFSLRPGKMTPMDTDIRVPLVIVGPGVAAGQKVTDIAENIDLSETFAQMAGAEPPATAEGHSLLELTKPGEAAKGWRNIALVEHRHPGPDITDPDLPEPKSGDPPTYKAIRMPEALYVEYGDTKNEIGYYDLKSDPDELHNIAGTLSAERLKKLHEALLANAGCQGAEACWKAQSMVP